MILQLGGTYIRSKYKQISHLVSRISVLFLAGVSLFPSRHVSLEQDILVYYAGMMMTNTPTEEQTKISQQASIKYIKGDHKSYNK